MMPEEVVKMDNICKEFSGVKVLKGVDFSLKPGEVHALVGENGAGKSTLMKILTGVYTKTSGTIYVDGKEVEFKHIRESQNAGIVMIHQEMNLMNHLTVSQNIFIGREFMEGPFLDPAKQNEQTAKLFKKLHVHIDPEEKVDNLTIAQQQMVEIAKALSFDSKVLIMDEPTATLTDNEIEVLFDIIRMLRNEGRSIIHISHRLEELKQIADRITVMRDGEYIDTVDTKSTDVSTIIKMMVGRQIFGTKQGRFDIQGAEPTLEVANLSVAPMIRDISFKAYAGEILGFAGLVGAGRTETARAIFGADRHDSGSIKVRGREIKIKTPESAVSNGIAYLSEDRRRYGLALGLEVESNISLPNMDSLSHKGFVKQKKCRQNAKFYVDHLAIKTPSLRQKVKYLSGGNQQKTVLAKWLTKNSDIIIFDEPTRGIDVGAKSEIYDLLNELAREKKTIIVISSELPEIIRCCHRVLVMCEGKITGELKGEDITQEAVMKYATMRKM